MLRGRPDKLSLLTFQVLKTLPTDGPASWAADLCTLLKRCGFENEYTQPWMCITKPKVFVKLCENKIRDHYQNLIEDNIETSKKLGVYKHLKEEKQQLQNYLRYVRSKKHRRALTQLRVSAHRLEVEAGRWANPEVEQNLRFCKLCDRNLVGDEFHLLFVCENLSELRVKYLDFCPDIPTVPYMLDLLKCVEPDRTAKLALFVEEAFVTHYGG